MNVYNLLGASYFPKQFYRYSTHQDFELRYIYESIVDRSRRAPLYKIKLNNDSHKFAIGLKDNAFAIQTEMEAAYLDGEVAVADKEAESLIQHFNDLLKCVADSSESNHFSARLAFHFKSLVYNHEQELNDSGIVHDENYFLKIKDTGESAAELPISKGSFLFELLQRVKEIVVDPMHYTQQSIVIYPNICSGYHNSNPYVTSIYSGMLFNYYC